MTSWKIPTAEDVDRAVACMVHVEQQRYFFERLMNPQWLKPLREKGFFSTPPLSEHDAAASTVQYRRWPAAAYLSRMATHAPELVADILMTTVPETDNPFVIGCFLDAAIAMPGAVAAKLAPTICRLLKAPFLIQAHSIGELAVHLARAHECEAALLILKPALEVIPDPRPVSEEIRNFDPRLQT